MLPPWWLWWWGCWGRGAGPFPVPDGKTQPPPSEAQPQPQPRGQWGQMGEGETTRWYARWGMGLWEECRECEVCGPKFWCGRPFQKVQSIKLFLRLLKCYREQSYLEGNVWAMQWLMLSDGIYVTIQPSVFFFLYSTSIFLIKGCNCFPIDS